MNEVEARVGAALKSMADTVPTATPPTAAQLRTGGPRRRGWLIAASAAAIVLAVATGVVVDRLVDPKPAARDLKLDVEAYGPNGQLAALTGRLEGRVVDGWACFGSTTSPIIWPPGFAAGQTSDGELVVRDADGTIVARAGEEVELGGGSNRIGPRQARSPCLTGDTAFMVGDVS